MDTNSLSAAQFGNQNGGTSPSSLGGPLGSSGQPGQGAGIGIGSAVA